MVWIRLGQIETALQSGERHGNKFSPGSFQIATVCRKPLRLTVFESLSDRYFGFMWQVCGYVPTTIECSMETGPDDINLSYLQVRRLVAAAAIRFNLSFCNFSLSSVSFQYIFFFLHSFPHSCNISFAIIHSYDFTFTFIRFSITQAKLGVSFILETLLHAKEKPSITQWMESTLKAFSASPAACEWFLLYMGKDPWWPMQILFKCPNQVGWPMRIY